MSKEQTYTRVPFRHIATASRRVTFIEGDNPVLWWSGLPKDFRDTHEMGACSEATKADYDAFQAALKSGQGGTFS